ncbi:ThiF family adenylyltransferase [Jiangella aurantiaca]|uniref:ThiF family adenylyltransferase n=1 Tax=Jiangella aurantiaca TaxID=2530373 RepID=A0A4R5AB70_9ACTN|nr:ThiF family adenylyltransferase [Jiangella aurantiaca]TDD68064.1 ThiF family adenylyltransferase [Jiangella aurantiaca]
MSTRRTSEWQARVLRDLAAFAVAYPGEVEMIGTPRYSGKLMHLRMRVHTADIERVDGGLRLRDHEEFQVTVGQSDIVPPRVEVDHLRFLDHAHVLQGTRLCLYLDPSREWDPADGFGGLVDRLIEWLGDAAAGRFDAQTALYHAVGGVLHETDGSPSVVVRGSLPAGRLVRNGWLIERTPFRYDLTLDRNRAAGSTVAEHVPVMRLDAALPLGAGSTLLTLLNVIEDPYAGYPAPCEAFTKVRWLTGLAAPFLTAAGASAIRKPDGTAQRIVIAVPHPTGGAPHLLVASLPAPAADRLRAIARASAKRSSIISIDPAKIESGTDVEWLHVSDERPEVTTRRDSTRPVSAFADKTVHVWGCGGLGSWVAEYVVRAGAKKVVLCDPGRVTGGLLVRQNFTEADVGDSKAEALAVRMRAISDTVEVTARDANMPEPSDWTDVDLVIDATISVAIGRVLDGAAATAERPVLAQMACDVRSGSQGILTVSMPPESSGCLTIDQQAGHVVKADGTLEPFHELWGSETDTNEVIPTRGCSPPTFHGSAADLSGVAGSLTSILGSHLASSDAVSGTHLISLPHGEAGPLRHFVPVAAPIETELSDG